MESPPELPIQGVPYARYIAIVGVSVLLIVLAVVLVSKPQLHSGLKPGTKVPPFAVPLASGTLNGSADIALHAHEGQRGKVPACEERPAGALNICALYEKGPVVLALVVDSGSCPAVLKEMQDVAGRFKDVSFAAVTMRSGHAEARGLVREQKLTIPLGFDEQGALTALYRVLSCPQLDFIYPGGRTQGKPMLSRPSEAALEARVSKLIASSRAEGWSPR
jgi:hypothetical protein